MKAPDPIVVSIDLAVPPGRAYEMFTARFSEWWPAATHSLSRHAQTRCSLDASVGGLLAERAPDGTRHVWGAVEALESGRRIRFTWHPGREPESAQWVEVVFARAGCGSRVTLTHGGWEALGEIAPLLRQEYAAGWRHVFGNMFAARAEWGR
jgi:uncharacterized protein YndB with AHSA1/START domain